jgi:carbon storage regulator CsrA
MEELGMLVLERKLGETIVVGEHIKFTICKISGTRVKIGTRAPRFSIRRNEIPLRGGNSSDCMLVLSRKERQSIVVGETVTLIVLWIGGTRVSLGIEAPGELRILRGELVA